MSNNPRTPLEAVDDPQAVSDAFTSGAFKTAVYGLGKMGLPLASVFADVTGAVIGADIDGTVVETVNNGQSHVTGEPGLDPLVAKTVNNGSLNATTDLGAAAETAQIHVVIVPTLITDDGTPDLSIVDSVTETIGHGLSDGDLVIIESTVPPRTCTERVLPTIANASGLDESKFGIAFCPERTKSGRAIKDIRRSWPKIVGGVSEEAGVAAETLYQSITENEVIRVSDATTAESVKVFEGVHRDVNIALANELATYTEALGINVREAIAAANTQDECDILRPGPGVGGHCIPYYPYFLFQQFDAESPLLRTARSVNDDMPAHVVGLLADRLADREIAISDANILLLGLTYRPGVAEIRASPSISISETLTTLGSDVSIVDPLLETYDAFSGTPIEMDELYDRSYDGIVIATPHEEFAAIDWNRFDSAVVVDTHGTADTVVSKHAYEPLAGVAVSAETLRERSSIREVVDAP